VQQGSWDQGLLFGRRGLRFRMVVVAKIWSGRRRMVVIKSWNMVAGRKTKGTKRQRKRWPP
jgi:hypothetical protein